MIDFVTSFFAKSGWRVEKNQPFAGSIVPLAFYAKDERVHSIMIEIRRDLIMDEASGDRKTDADKVFSLFAKLIEGVSVESEGGQ